MSIPGRTISSLSASSFSDQEFFGRRAHRIGRAFFFSLVPPAFFFFDLLLICAVYCRGLVGEFFALRDGQQVVVSDLDKTESMNLWRRMDSTRATNEGSGECFVPVLTTPRLGKCQLMTERTRFEGPVQFVSWNLTFNGCHFGWPPNSIPILIWLSGNFV